MNNYHIIIPSIPNHLPIPSADDFVGWYGEKTIVWK